MNKHTSTYTVCKQEKTGRNRELFCVEEADFHAACWFTMEQERLVSRSSWANNTTSPGVIYMDCVCACACVSVCVVVMLRGVSPVAALLHHVPESAVGKETRERERERHERQVKEHDFR